jgi:hypothetical protein
MVITTQKMNKPNCKTPIFLILVTILGLKMHWWLTWGSLMLVFVFGFTHGSNVIIIMDLTTGFIGWMERLVWPMCLLMCLGCLYLKWWSMGPLFTPLLLLCVHDIGEYIVNGVYWLHMWLSIINHWGMDIRGFLASCSIDVSYVERIKSLIYCNALLGGAVVLVSPLPYAICSQMLISNKVKTHYWGAKIVVTLYCFLEVPCLNFNNVIIMKDFHNAFAYYGKSKPK